MVDISFNTWFPVLTLMAGYTMKLVEDRLTHQRTMQRERESRRDSRRIQLAERHADFQRKTLLDLQEALQDLLRACGAIIHADAMKFRETGLWGKAKVEEEISQKQFDSNRKCILLIVRVADDEIRKKAHEFRQAVMTASNSPDEKTANDRMFATVSQIDNLHELIGKQLRTIDETEQAQLNLTV
ncbi:MAG TPA: hypothetical protein VFB79_22620 [Candidatus Angelobacter sp.]|nr:hypothetical protein [Candidatus Angelobacter sp.]